MINLAKNHILLILILFFCGISIALYEIHSIVLRRIALCISGLRRPYPTGLSPPAARKSSQNKGVLE
jgi:hypothetical protein